MSVTETLVSPPRGALRAGTALATGRAHVPLLGALLAAAGLLTLAAAGAGTLAGDVALTRWAQRVALPGVEEMTGFANWAGGGARLTATAIVSALALAVAGRFQAAALVAAGLLVHVANALLKAAADSPRPTTDVVRVTDVADGAGFPSGHVMGVTLFYGTVFVLAPALARSPAARRLVQVLAVVMVAATGFARVYDGAHWPSDVLGGYLWGTLCLLLLLRGQRAVLAAAVPFYRRSVSGWRVRADRNRAADPA